MEEAVSHVLYISHDCKVCHALRGRGIPNGVRVENVMDIIPLPAWLDGTPTLVDVSVGVLYKGSDSLIVLEHMRQKQAQISVFQEPAATPRPPPQHPQHPQRPQHPQHPQHPQLPANMPRVPDRPFKPKPESSENKTGGWKDLFNQALPEPVEDESKPLRLGEDSVGEMLSRRALAK
jgi:hypothetical protein